MPNRNPLKQLFITFPHSGDVKVREFVETMGTKLKYEHWKACEETHEDGSPHIHMACILAIKLTMSKLKKIKQLLYPNDYCRINIQPAKFYKNSLEYFEKEDLDPIQSHEWVPPNAKKARETRFYTEQMNFCISSGIYRGARDVDEFRRFLQNYVARSSTTTS